MRKIYKLDFTVLEKTNSKHVNVAIVIDVFRAFSTASYVLKQQPNNYIFTTNSSIISKINNPAASSGVLFKTTEADGRDTNFYIPCLDFLHNLLFAFRLHVFQPYWQNIHLSKIHHPKELISL